MVFHAQQFVSFLQDRDDELAAQVEILDNEKDEDDGELNSSSGMKIMLAPSETKPMTRYGALCRQLWFHNLTHIQQFAGIKLLKYV